MATSGYISHVLLHLTQNNKEDYTIKRESYQLISMLQQLSELRLYHDELRATTSHISVDHLYEECTDPNADKSIKEQLRDI